MLDIRRSCYGKSLTINIECVYWLKGLNTIYLALVTYVTRCILFFYTLGCLIEHESTKSLVFKSSMVDNIYLLDLDDVSMYGTKCLDTKNGDSLLWHRCLGYVHFDLINKITYKNLVVGLQKINFLKINFVMLIE